VQPLTETTLLYLLPEIVLVLTATAIYVVGAFGSARQGWSWMAQCGIALAAYALFRQAMSRQLGIFSDQLTGPLVVDHLAFFVRWLALAVAALLVLLTARAARDEQGPETTGSVLLVMAGVMLSASAADLVLLFVSLELISIPTYVLLYISRRDASGQESAIKYFFLSILSSAVLLYGLSFLYGVGGSTHLGEIRAALVKASGVTDVAGAISLAHVALVLIVGGLAFKIAAVPFHFYAADVYQGTTHANAGLLAVAPKIAGVVVLVRIVVAAMPGNEAFAWKLLLVMSMVTMTLGNVVALWQNNIRRMLAYSSIAHAGYLLIGLAVGLATTAGSIEIAYDGLAATMLYLSVYALATIGAFSALSCLGKYGPADGRLDALAGLTRSQPIIALAMAVFMFSLAGIPPLAGFWGKLTLLGGALDVHLAPGDADLRGWFLALAIVGAINAAIAAAYYLRVISVMYFRPAKSAAPLLSSYGAFASMLVCALAVVAIGVYPGPLVGQSSRATEQVRENLELKPNQDAAGTTSTSSD
jgi:NADH-quinone oxidoreductase subunit N